MQSVVFSEKQETLSFLKQIVEQTAKAMEEDKIRRSVDNFKSKIQKCLEKQGGHFEAEL